MHRTDVHLRRGVRIMIRTLAAITVGSTIAAAIAFVSLPRAKANHFTLNIGPPPLLKLTPITMKSVSPKALAGLGLALVELHGAHATVTEAQAEHAALSRHKGPVLEAVLAQVRSDKQPPLNGRLLWVISLKPPANDMELTTGREIHPTALLAFVDPQTGRLVGTDEFTPR